MITTLTLALLAGMALGVFFFAGLWWTVRKGLVAANPALWFLGSFLLRTAVVLAGFYALGADDWRKLLAALVGFVLARVFLTRFTASKSPHPPFFKGGQRRRAHSCSPPLQKEGLGEDLTEVNHAPEF